MRRLFFACVLLTVGVWWLACTSFSAGSIATTQDATTAESATPSNQSDAAAPSVADASFCDDAQGWRRCFDFDRVNQLKSPFGFDIRGEDSPTAEKGPLGRLVVDSNDKWSEPNSLLVETGDGGTATLDLAVGTATTIRLRARIKVVEIVKGDSSSTHFLSLYCQNDKSTRIYLKVTGEGKIGIKQDSSDGGGPDPSSIDVPNPSSWYAIEVDWSNATNSSSVSVKVDGKDLFIALPTIPLSCPMILRLGSNVSVPNAIGSGTYVLRYDDILVDWN